MNLTLRLATTADAALIADISRQTFYDTYVAHNTKANMDKFLGEQFTKGRLMMEVGTRDNIFLIAYHQQEVAGYIKLRTGKEPPDLKQYAAMEVARIYVVKEFIGKGVGQFLMQACVDTAKQKGKNLLWLIVWKENKRAIDFYNRWGFEKFGECEFLLGDDVQQDWMMKKELV